MTIPTLHNSLKKTFTSSIQGLHVEDDTLIHFNFSTNINDIELFLITSMAAKIFIASVATANPGKKAAFSKKLDKMDGADLLEAFHKDFGNALLPVLFDSDFLASHSIIDHHEAHHFFSQAFGDDYTNQKKSHKPQLVNTFLEKTILKQSHIQKIDNSGEEGEKVILSLFDKIIDVDDAGFHILFNVHAPAFFTYYISHLLSSNLIKIEFDSKESFVCVDYKCEFETLIKAFAEAACLYSSSKIQCELQKALEESDYYKNIMKKDVFEVGKTTPLC